VEREIWFEKWLWSYMPCHWKGVAAMIAVITPTLAAIFLAQYVAGENADWLQLPIFLLV